MCPAENKVMPSKYAGRKVLSYEKTDYYRQGGELVAGYSSYEQWFDLKKAEELNIFAKTDLVKMPEYTEQELKEIYAAQDREEIQMNISRPIYSQRMLILDKRCQTANCHTLFMSAW
jgi:hypothetical protein